ncbi:MAG TPA: hypothetical protein VNZ44_06590 [Pyrinomonadaceae bacterium]|nr:hypothetical protein [Pyrinomonadaceae bacterium]
MRPNVRLVARTFAALALVALACAPTAQGRQTTRTNSIDQLLRERQRIIYGRALEEDMRKPAERAEEEQRLALAQIKEDYVRLQVVNKDLSKAASQKEALDLKEVVKSTAEMKRRAERLLENLALPELQEEAARSKPNDIEREEQLKASLLALGQLVERFVRNPIFREVNVIDAQSSTRARRDLQSIITISERLRRESEKLDKGTP